MDEEIKTKACPNCGNQECHDDDEYCFNCGVSLLNFCTNDCCSLNNGEPIALPDNYCYCPHCGEETDFFKNKWIKPTVYNQSQQDVPLTESHI